MSVKTEQVDVKYCDICGERESPMHRMYQCERCRKDVCPSHHHTIGGDHISVQGRRRWYLRVCPGCRDDFTARIDPILREFRPDDAEAG